MSFLSMSVHAKVESGLAIAVRFAIILLVAPRSLFADVPVSQRAEVEHLFEYVRTSKCQIERNGQLYAAAAAEEHMQKKYEHFRDEIDSTEKFIDLAASRSEVSKKPYLVRCDGKMAMPTRGWLLAELARFRASRR
jgi:hypothetical protein